MHAQAASCADFAALKLLHLYTSIAFIKTTATGNKLIKCCNKLLAQEIFKAVFFWFRLCLGLHGQI